MVAIKGLYICSPQKSCVPHQIKKVLFFFHVGLCKPKSSVYLQPLSKRRHLKVHWIIENDSAYTLRKQCKIRKQNHYETALNLSIFLLLILFKVIQWRVWSWLRMNASGRLNTCKSNGNIGACTRWRVAHGCVTRMQSTFYWRIAFRNEE